MRKLVAAALAVSIAMSAQAQLTGGVTGAVGATTGTAGATVGAGTSLGADTDVVGDTMDGTRRAAGDATRPTAHDARAATKASPMVNAGAGVRVTRETRCYDGADYYDPYYNQGYYYCETSGPSAQAKAGSSRF